MSTQAGSLGLSLRTTLGIGAALAVSFYGAKWLLRTRRQKKVTMIIETLSSLNRKCVHIKDKAKVESKVCQLIEGGCKKLQVITDFDYTLTRVHKDGNRLATSYGVLDSAIILPQFIRDEVKALYQKYYPIEIDPKLSLQEKLPLMVEWYQKSHDVLVNSRICKDDIDHMVEASNATLRDGADSLLQSLNDANVPVLVFSGGVGDVLESIIRHHQVFYPNIHIVSNYMKFDDDGIISGFKDEIIHTLNKNENAIHSSDYFKKLHGRTNVILLGDMLGDLQMSEGVENLNVILKIGFLNDKISASLPIYMDQFDIVLTDDQTMDVVNEILQKVL